MVIQVKLKVYSVLPVDNGFRSSVARATSSCPAGMPQGLMISPTLFNVYNNDLEESGPITQLLGRASTRITALKMKL